MTTMVYPYSDKDHHDNCYDRFRLSAARLPSGRLTCLLQKTPADFPAVLLSYSKFCLPDIVSIVTNFIPKGKDFLPANLSANAPFV